MNTETIFEYDGSITDVIPHPTNANIIYIIVQKGYVIELNRETNTRDILLDMTEEILQIYEQRPMKLKFADERGLYRIAFHPEFHTRGSLFEGVFIAMFAQLEDTSKFDIISQQQVPQPDHMTCIAQFVKKNAPQWTKDTRIDILCVPEPQANHNGGGLLFGPDDYLYIGLGDGGGANDEHGELLTDNKDSYLGFAQDLNSYHGKILRVEVVQPMMQKINLIIPQDNPLVDYDGDGRKEIFAWGIRNPWSMVFHDEELYVGDVGQNRVESVKKVTSGTNHGWRAMEGNEIFNQDVLEYIKEIPEDIVHPIIAYPREEGIAITGVQFLGDIMIFSDYGGNIFHADFLNDRWERRIIGNLGIRVHGLSKIEGDIYILSFDSDVKKGQVMRLILDDVISSSYHETLLHNVPLSYEDTPRYIFKYSDGLTDEDIDMIVENVIDVANRTNSLLRPNSTTKMHISIIRRNDPVATLKYSMDDAWDGSIDISKRKAYTALAFSSNENALTTRTIGLLSQPGSPLWQIGNSNPNGGIIEFPGGIPLYKNGELVGAIGVSGDGVDQDEIVALAGTLGFEASEEIRSDSVAGVPYTKSEETKREVIKIVGRGEWTNFVKESKDVDIKLFISGDREIINLSRFSSFSDRFISMNFFATTLKLLDGVERYVNLVSLNVSRTFITDNELVYLLLMKQLIRLELNGNDIENISSISGLINLTKLGLACTHVLSLEPLRGMKKLKILDLYQTPTSDYKSLKYLESLEDLDIRYSNINEKDINENIDVVYQDI